MISRFSLLGALCLLASPAWAQDYPARPPTIVVPFAAGGPFDIVGREAAETLSQKLGKQFVIENRVGAGGVSGTRYVMNARPDGYTLLLGSPGPLVIAPSANPGSLDIEGKLLPIGIIAESPQVLVVSSKLSAQSVGELAALGKSQSGSMNFGSAGIGTTPHLSAELFKKITGVALSHVPYRGTASAMQDLVRGELHMMFGDIGTLKPFIDAGSIRALAITGGRRSKLLPDVPTAAEAGYPTLMVRNFSVLLAPASTPAPVVDVLVKGLAEAKADRALVEKLESQGMSMIESSPEHARQYLRAEQDSWGPLVQSIGLKLTP